MVAFFFVTTLAVVDRRSASAAPYFDGQTLFDINKEGITVFGQTYLWPYKKESSLRLDSFFGIYDIEPQGVGYYRNRR